MDTITHTLFGLTLYGTVDKRSFSKKEKQAYLFATVIGSQIPDIDVVSKLWDSQGQYQMWHRGITHSFFLIPLWALLIAFLCLLLWKVKDRRLFFMAALAVFIHSTSDLFNAWGTGYLEPFASSRITFGTISIIDFAIWGIIGITFLLVKFMGKPSFRMYRLTWLAIAFHIAVQSVQGYMIYNDASEHYEQVALSANFIPWNYTVIGKSGGFVEIATVNLWSEPVVQVVLTSQEDASLEQLFSQRPEAKTLYEWSPFVVVVNDDERIGIYDPRFYRNGQSFLFEYIEKQGSDLQLN